MCRASCLPSRRLECIAKRKAPVVQQLDMQLWVSCSCRCCTSCWKHPWIWIAADICGSLINVESTPATSTGQSLRKSGRAFTTCAGGPQALVLGGHEVCGHQRDPGTLQLEKEDLADCEGHHSELRCRSFRARTPWGTLCTSSTLGATTHRQRAACSGFSSVLLACLDAPSAATTLVELS